MLGGIIQSILSGITGVIMAIVQPILELILGFVNRFILGPLIQLVFNLLSYSISLLFYDIACFILALIDYVEMMFRLLAGLDVDGVTLNLANSPDKGSDLVVQLIRTPEVRDIFLAMVVVGMFLLIITTIFQMIKVEYTTEGAKNAKGPILNKAFKGLCNMILLPALCVFGVVLGNQVLDLLDKATKPDADLLGQSATISGTLFVAAAAEAHYQKSDFRVVFISPTPSLALMELPINIVPILINSIFDAWGDAFNADDQKNYLFPDAVRKESESLVASGTISYWNIAAISQIYDYSKINYLLLIFGGCIVIKTLYYTCFGMIVRLYQCGMLFIISPAVIGMSPVNESGLGKWRSEFVGQAISAYGVVLALNIFFVLVRVLLSIDFSFEGVTGYFFGASMMEGLLKAIIVMGGTLTIEKFAKELGGYFGAKDALSQGKEMEGAIKKAVQDIGNGIVKAVGTAVQVAMMATGVGGAAVGGLKAAGGAMKAASAASKAAGGGLKGLAAGAKNLGGSMRMGMGDTFANIGQAAADYVGADVDIKGAHLERKRAHLQQAMEFDNADTLRVKETGKAVADQQAVVNATKEEIKREEARGDYEAANIARARLRGEESTLADLESDHSKAKKRAARTEARMASPEAQAARAKATEYYSAQLAAVDGQAEDYNKTRDSQKILRREAGRQAAKAGWENLTLSGKVFSGVKKQFEGYEQAASKEGGKEVAAAYEHMQKVRSDRKEDAANARNETVITRKNLVQMAEMQKIAAKEVDVAKSQIRLSAQSSIQNMNNWEQQRKDAVAANDTSLANALAQQIQQTSEALRQQLGLGAGEIGKNDAGVYEIKVDIDQHLGHLDKVNEILEAIRNSGKGMEDQDAIKQAVHDAVEGLAADKAKEIQEMFEKVVAKYKK